jgi:SAM-dependent methyltransferase
MTTKPLNSDFYAGDALTAFKEGDYKGGIGLSDHRTGAMRLCEAVMMYLQLPIPHDGPILDIGAGYGSLFHMLVAMDAAPTKYVGVEPSPALFDHMSQRCEHLLQGSNLFDTGTKMHLLEMDGATYFRTHPEADPQRTTFILGVASTLSEEEFKELLASAMATSAAVVVSFLDANIYRGAFNAYTPSQVMKWVQSSAHMVDATPRINHPHEDSVNPMSWTIGFVT